MILLLDNKDSFVWNLAQALAVLGARVRVERSDEVTLDSIGGARGLVLSPGPGRPEQAGRSLAAIRRWSGALPILGVCLGHQAIGIAFGAELRRGPPVHGRATAIDHDGRDLFAGLPSPFRACRYHSLYLATVPDVLTVTARDEAGGVMAIRHRTHPTFGVQFHPESFRTEHGTALLQNFLAAVAA
ncbi:MAG: aminodeoxychorismate/anthranilate synthase component II [Planctomycetes bacterium]|nr:aminodeoxychorismate/anthranilate synthase component II [Planctomycetota bacterium]